MVVLLRSITHKGRRKNTAAAARNRERKRMERVVSLQRLVDLDAEKSALEHEMVLLNHELGLLCGVVRTVLFRQ